MRLISLSLRGACGVEKGLGLDQVDIDFTRFDAGLVAIVGPNGAGKSTLMESCTPYRTLASRPGSLQQHFALKDSHRDLRFEMNGHTYRCRLLVDGVRGKQESYLYRDDEPLNDGKTPSYDAVVRELFGSEDLFFRSLFRSQSAASIADLTTGKRKDFFVELLGLARIADYHESAKARARECEDALASDRARIEVLRSQADDFTAAEDERDSASERLDGIRAHLHAAEMNISSGRERYAEADRAVVRLSVAVEGLEDARKRLAEARQRASAAEARVHAAEEAASALALRTDRERADAGAARLRAVTDAADRRARAKKIASNRERILEGITALEGLRDVVAGFEEERARDASYRNTVAEANAQIAAMESEHAQWRIRREAAEDALSRAYMRADSDHDARIARMEDALADVERTAALTGEVPCTGMEIQPACTLLQKAVEAADSLSRLRAELEAARTVNQRATPEIKSIEAALAEIMTAKPSYDTRAEATAEAATESILKLGYDSARHDEARKALREQEAKNWHGLLAEADAAADTVEQCSLRIDEAERLFVDTLTSMEERRAAEAARVDRDHAAAQADLADAAALAESLLAKVRKIQAAEIEYRDAVATRDAAARKVAELEATCTALRRDAVDLGARLAEADARVNACARALQEAGALESAIAPRVRELEEWLLLARATGKDGIQALELDAAGPGVAAIANDLLADTFGSGFRVSFETTRLSADGKSQLEVFDIRVLTGDGEQPIEMLSGGQKVWIEAALSQAVAIYLRRKSGLDLRTSFLDEADGALDVENAWHYLEMLRAAHRTAGTHHTFLITHRRELLAHIPQQIRLVPGVGLEYAV